ncbi:DLW-39 family protein [Kineococcus arenarius]|uniref:DLW-39 family protein n=1 Tax=unclassified Kineococcus TaxID=2621656 RepID=UPI003D7EFE94
MLAFVAVLEPLWRSRVKKLLLVAAVAGAALAWRRKASAKAERDLWAEATDTVR